MPQFNPVSSGPVATVPFWINGKACELNEAAKTFPIVSAQSEELVHLAASASSEEAYQACESAGEALKKWRCTSAVHRRNILNEAATVWERRADEIAQVASAETSCLISFAKWGVLEAAKYMREIAAATTEIRGVIPQRTTHHHTGMEEEGLTLVTTEPIGAILVIPP